MTAMMYLAEILVILICVVIFMVLIIIAVEYDKAHKWDDIYKKRGRDDD